MAEPVQTASSDARLGRGLIVRSDPQHPVLLEDPKLESGDRIEA